MWTKTLCSFSLTVIMLSGCSGPVADSVTESQLEVDLAIPLHLIDYAHSDDGKLVHGTISDFDGDVKATWTTDTGSTNVAMSMDELFGLWQTLTSSDIFTQSIVTDENAELDPEKFHVISIIEKYNGKTMKQTHLVPTDSTSPVLREWIDNLKIPK